MGAAFIIQSNDEGGIISVSDRDWGGPIARFIFYRSTDAF
jgi:hypothetical protein